MFILNNDGKCKTFHSLNDEQLLEYTLSSEEIGAYKMLGEIVKLLQNIDTIGTIETIDDLKYEIINFAVTCNVRHIVRRGEIEC